MKKNLFKGSCTALVTPFNESGNINFFELKRLIEFQIASGTNAIVILGTTGESSTISESERETIIKFCVTEAGGRVPIIVGTGSNSTKKAISQTKQAEILGADGALIVTPYYNKCSQSGLFEHYKLISKSTNIPIIIYNVPSRTGVNILPKTAIKISRLKNIIGIKEASGNMSQICELLSTKPKNFHVYSGDDALTFPMLCLGASGVISVTANAYPYEVSLLCKYVFEGEIEQAKFIHNYLFKINQTLFLDINPICIKQYLNILGRNVGGTRPPLTPTSKEIKDILKQTKKHYET